MRVEIFWKLVQDRFSKVNPFLSDTQGKARPTKTSGTFLTGPRCNVYSLGLRLKARNSCFTHVLIYCHIDQIMCCDIHFTKFCIFLLNMHVACWENPTMYKAKSLKSNQINFFNHTPISTKVDWCNSDYHDRKELWAFKKFQYNQATTL